MDTIWHNALIIIITWLYCLPPKCTKIDTNSIGSTTTFEQVHESWNCRIGTLLLRLMVCLAAKGVPGLCFWIEYPFTFKITYFTEFVKGYFKLPAILRNFEFKVYYQGYLLPGSDLWFSTPIACGRYIVSIIKCMSWRCLDREQIYIEINRTVHK